MKVIWTDGKYALTYTCDDVSILTSQVVKILTQSHTDVIDVLQIQDDDYCAPGQDYVDVIARDLDPIPSYIIDIMKQQLTATCFEPGEIVESSHTGQLL